MGERIPALAALCVVYNGMLQRELSALTVSVYPSWWGFRAEFGARFFAPQAAFGRFARALRGAIAELGATGPCWPGWERAD